MSERSVQPELGGNSSCFIATRSCNFGGDLLRMDRTHSPEHKMTRSQVRRWNAVVDHELCAVVTRLSHGSWLGGALCGQWAMCPWAQQGINQTGVLPDVTALLHVQFVPSQPPPRKQRQGHATEQLRHALCKSGRRVRQLTPARSVASRSAIDNVRQRYTIPF